MVGTKALGIASCILVLLLITTTAAGAQFNKATAPLKVAGKNIAKEAENPHYLNNRQLIGKPIASPVAKSGKGIAIAAAGSASLPQQTPNFSQICNTPGFACGGEPRSYVYGEGDAVHYRPHATQNLSGNGSGSGWFYLSPCEGHCDAPPRWDIPSANFYTLVNPRETVYGVCLAAPMEWGELESFDVALWPSWTSYNASEAVQRTEDVVSKCEEYGAAAYSSTCMYGANQWWRGWKILNPAVRGNADVIPITLGHFGEVAWCNFNLQITQQPTVRVTNAATGAINVTWATSIRSNETMEIRNLATGEVTRVTGTSRIAPKLHSLAYSGLPPGNYAVTAFSAIDDDSPLLSNLWYKSAQSDAINFSIATVPVIHFTGPTPPNGTALVGDRVDIAVSSTEPLANATLVFNLSTATGEYDFNMTQVNSTYFAQLVTGLPAGTQHYQVRAIGENGQPGVSEVRSVTLTIPTSTPVITFIAPTPTSGTTLANDNATIRISSTEPLASATLHLTQPNGTRGEYPMAEFAGSPTAFNADLTGLRSGINTYYVSGVDADEGAYAVTDTGQSFNVPLPLAMFVPPTPLDGASQTSTGVTVSITAGEPLANATLVWADPSGATSQYVMAGGPVSFSTSLDELAIGSHSYRVDFIDAEGDASTTEARRLTVATIPITPPVITFTPPTPASGATLATHSATIAIGANEPLTSAILHLALPNATIVDFPMGADLEDPSSFTRSISELHAGSYSYTVSGIDADEGATGISETRTFNIAPLVITFAEPPTPANGTLLANDSVTVSIAASEPLVNATLVLISPYSTVAHYTMDELSATEFSITRLHLLAGQYAFYAEGVNEVGDSANSETRLVDVPLPVVTFTPPTPVDQSNVTNGTTVTFSISSNEPLLTADLVLTSPAGEVTIFEMGGINTTAFTYSATLAILGAYTYRVDATDYEEDTTTTETRTLNSIASREPSTVVIGLGTNFSTVQNSPWQYQYHNANGTRINMTYDNAGSWFAGEAPQSHWANISLTDDGLTTHPGTGGGGQYPYPVLRYDIRNAGNYSITGSITCPYSGAYCSSGTGANYTFYINGTTQFCSVFATPSSATIPINCAEPYSLGLGSYIEIEEQSGTDSFYDGREISFTLTGTTQ